jgi:type VI protein secretion system component VasF
MDDVLKVLKAIVSSFSEFGSIPKPIRVCIALFSSIFGFSLIFVYAHLSKQQTIFLVSAIVIMGVVTGAYYLFKGGQGKESGSQQPPGEWERAPSSPPPSSSATSSRVAVQSPGTEHFWDAPARARPAAVQRQVQPVAAASASAVVRGPLQTMTLLELTEPLFQYICRLNRIARRGKSGETTTFLTKTAAAAASVAGPAAAPGRGAALDEVVVRSEIKALLEDLVSKASVDLRLSQQVGKIELPLIFFIDSMIAESALPFAAQWNQHRLAYDREELAGDEKFYDLLDETLKESGEDAAERLAVFYICIGLGFSGIYFKQPEFLRKTMLGIAPRIRHLVENDQTARICPEAYQGIDTRNLVEPPGNRMVLVGLVFGCFTLAVLISYVLMYREASRNLNNSIEEVLRQDLAAEQTQ